MRRVIVLGGRGFFGRAAADQLRTLGVHLQTASRSTGADLRIDANDSDSIRAKVRPGDIVLDAAGPYHGRSLALIESAIRVGFDVVDLNDDLQYAESVLSRAPQIAEAGIRVLSSASTVSAFAAAAMRIVGPNSPRRLTSFLMPATRYTASAGTAMSLLRTVGRPIRILRDGQLRIVHGWCESRSIYLPPPLRTIRGHLFESADALWLPRICPSLEDVAMYVDANTFGANAMLTVAAHSRVVRQVMQRELGLGTWLRAPLRIKCRRRCIRVGRERREHGRFRALRRDEQLSRGDRAGRSGRSEDGQRSIHRTRASASGPLCGPGRDTKIPGCRGREIRPGAEALLASSVQHSDRSTHSHLPTRMAIQPARPINSTNTPHRVMNVCESVCRIVEPEARMIAPAKTTIDALIAFIYCFHCSRVTAPWSDERPAAPRPIFGCGGVGRPACAW